MSDVWNERFKLIGTVLNTMEHILPGFVGDCMFVLISKLPEDYFSDECWACGGDIVLE